MQTLHARLAQPEVVQAQPAQYLANHYHGLGSQRNDFRNHNLNCLIASMVTGDSVLDIGCGSGRLLTMLQRDGRQGFGIDPNPDLIEMAGRLNPRLRIYEGIGDDIGRLGRRFSTITIIDVLEHIKDDRRQLRKIHDALRPAGQLIVLVPAFQMLFGKRDHRNGHFRRYSRKELIEKVTEAGFRVTRARYWNAMGFLPYLIAERIFRRELNGDLRTDEAKNPFERALVRILHAWYKGVENRFNFGLGLSLICVARKG